MQFKRVKLIFDSQFCGQEDLEINIPACRDDAYIQSLFDKLLGVPYNKEACRYEIIEFL